MTKAQMICISKCCRLCLSKSNTTLVNMQCLASDKVSYLSKLQLIAPSLIDNPRNDLMVWICEHCRQKLNDAYNFIQNCFKSDALLEKYCLQLTSSYTSQNEFRNSDESVFNLTENIKESIRNPIKEECILDVSNIEGNQTSFESLFIIDNPELPTVNLKIKLESNDPLINYNIPSSFESIENVPKVYSIVVKEEPDFNIGAYDETQNDEVVQTESSFNQGENLPDKKKIAETNCRSSTSSYSDVCSEVKKRAYKCNFNSFETLDKNRSVTSEERQNRKFNQSTSLCSKEKPYECNMCKKKFKLSYSLKLHERIHSGESIYKCNVCPKIFSRSHNLKIHEMIHSGVFPYNCSACDKKFRNSYRLKLHEMIHSGDLPYECNTCPKKFNRSSSLNIHKRVHTGEFPYKCNMCPKKFNYSNNLKKHERHHSGGLPFKCSMCPKKFKLLSTLKTHEMIHSGELPHKCSICPKEFKHLSILKAHERIHSGELPFKCNTCHRKFNHSSNLKKHEKNHIAA